MLSLCDCKTSQKFISSSTPDPPEEDEVGVDVDGPVHGGEHVGDEEPLRGAHTEHGPHILPVLRWI